MVNRRINNVAADSSAPAPVIRNNSIVNRRINVLGASGSGASTVGKLLADRCGIPFFDCDDYFHIASDPPFQVQRSPAERARLIAADLQPTGDWVLAGGVAGWNPCPDLQFTLFVFLYVPTAIRLTRLRERELSRFGPRILPGGDMEETHRSFIHWASRYDSGELDGKSLQRHEQYLSVQNCPVLRFDGEFSPQQMVDDILYDLEGK